VLGISFGLGFRLPLGLGCLETESKSPSWQSCAVYKKGMPSLISYQMGSKPFVLLYCWKPGASIRVGGLIKKSDSIIRTDGSTELENARLDRSLHRKQPKGQLYPAVKLYSQSCLLLVQELTVILLHTCQLLLKSWLFLITGHLSLVK